MLEMTYEQIDAIYDILVEECGAPDGHDALSIRSQFFFHFPACGEFRFMGSLGFGGKVWAPSGRRPPRVSCYREDATPGRLAAIDRANERLEALYG